MLININYFVIIIIFWQALWCDDCDAGTKSAAGATGCTDCLEVAIIRRIVNTLRYFLPDILPYKVYKIFDLQNSDLKLWV